MAVTLCCTAPLTYVTTNQSAGRKTNCRRSDLKLSEFTEESTYSRLAMSVAIVAKNSITYRLQSYTSRFINIHQNVYYLPPCKVPSSCRRKLEKHMCTSLSRHVCYCSLRLNDRQHSFIQRCIGIKFYN